MQREQATSLQTVLLDHLSEGVCLLTPDGHILYINAAGQEALSLAGPVGNIDELANDFISPDEWQALLHTAPATLSTHTPLGKLHLHSRLQMLDDRSLVQITINLERAAPADSYATGEQLTALARISRELNATLLLEDVLAAVLDEALLNTGADSGQISLYDDDGQPSNSWQRGQVVPVPLADQQVSRRHRSAVAAELGEDGNGSGLRSALVTPILYGDAVAGLLRLFSGESGFFDKNAETFVAALANHAATAIGNARRFQEIQERNVLLQQRTQQLEHFVESGRVFSGDRPLEDVYEDLVYAIQEGVGYDAVLLNLAERQGSQSFLRPVTAAGLPLERLRNLQRERYSWETLSRLMQPEYGLGGAFFVPAADAVADGALAALQLADELVPDPASKGEADGWHAGDLFFIPMRDQQGHPLGLISLAAPRDGRQPELNTARVLEIFANQTANAIENVQLFHDMRDYAIELQQLHNVSQQVLREPDFGEKLQYIVDGLQVSGWERVALTLRNQDYEPTLLVTSGLSRDEHAYLWENMLPAADWRRRFADAAFHRFRRGSSYFIPAEAPEARESSDYGLSDETGVQLDSGAWHPDDVLIRPLYTSEGEMAGMIALDQPTDGRRPEERALQTIDLYAQFAISVLENFRLFNDIDRHRRELQTLFDASNALAGTLNSQQILLAMGEHLLRAAGADRYAIYASGDNGELISLLSSAPEERHHQNARQQQLYHEVLATGNPILQPASTDEGNGEAIALLPLTIRDRLYGLVELARRERAEDISTRGVFGADTLPLLGAILNQGSVALEIARLFQELDERVAARTAALAAESERVKILLRIATELSSSLDRDVVLNLALQLVKEVVHAHDGNILLIDPERDELIVQATLGDRAILPAGGLPSGLRPGEGLARWIIQNRAAVVVDDTLQDDRWVGTQIDADARSALGVPLIAGPDVLGVMLLTASRPSTFTAEQLSLVEAAGIQAAGAIQNASLYDLVRQQAERLGVMMREAQIEVAKQQSMLESIADGVLVAEASGTIVMANLPAARILDLPRHQLMGKRVGELYGLYGEAGDAWVERLGQWAAAPERLGPQSIFRERLETGNQVINIHASPVFANNRYFGAIAIFRDVTKEVEVDRMKSEFVSTVSHELRTPMTSIKGYADLILMGVAGELNPSQTRYLEVIKKNADRLQMLVNDLLDISRIETGKTQLARQPLDIPRMIASVVNEHLRGRLQHEGKEIAVSTEIAPSLPLVDADLEKVTRVLTNLIDNAINYTPAGGTIHVSAWANRNFVYVSVRDTGIGIAPEDQKRIFERFYRADNEAVQAVPGTGLGLAIVQSLVEMHGGEMALVSEPGAGSTFTFGLPVTPGESTGNW